MALIDFPSRGASRIEQEALSENAPSQAFNVEPIHPLETREGILNLEHMPLPTFSDVSIEYIEETRRSDMDTKHGKYYQRDLHFSDGTRRREYVGIANNPTSAIPVVKKPAWWTSNNQGFNKTTTDKLHARGRHSITEGIALNKPHSLYRNVWDVHLALEKVGNEFSDILQTEIIDVEGDSNGAMEGTGIMAYGPEFKRNVQNAYLVDPCIVRKIGLVDIKKFLRHPDYFMREIYCLGRQAIRLARDEEENIRDYIQTIELTKEFFIGNLLLTRGLFWGEFGHVLAHVPENQKAHYQLFAYSIANQKREFFAVLRGSTGFARQGITTQTVTGTHLSIANPRTIRAKIDYLTAT